MVLTKADLLGDPGAWPPEDQPRKAALVKELLDYVAADVLGGRPERIDPRSSLRGYRVATRECVGVLPACLLGGRVWNVDTLADFIARYLPESALLDYAQALQRKEQLRRISTSTTRRFSAAASGIGAAPIPIADIAVLTPLQLLLVAFIAGLSCRRFSLESAREFTAATGINVGAAMLARETARAGVRFLPGFGSAISGMIANWVAQPIIRPQGRRSALRKSRDCPHQGPTAFVKKSNGWEPVEKTGKRGSGKVSGNRYGRGARMWN
jgi:uncharacterized protein (DUF697 family)